MLKRFSISALSVIVACLILACSLPLTFIIGADEFQPENLLQTAVASADGILFDVNTGTYTTNSKFDENNAIDGATDGDTAIHYDVYGWDATTKVGVLYTLKDSYYVGNANIFSGLDGYPDCWSVYASADLDNLFSSNYLSKQVCENEKISATINAKVQYIAFVFESDGGRVKELELWSAYYEEPQEFQSENLLQTAVVGADGILYDTTNSSYTINSKFGENGAIAGATDGDTANHYDVYGWNATTKVGVLYTLNGSYYVGNANIFSGLDGYPDSWSVYASKDLDSLFDNIYLNSIECQNTKIEVPINATVKYIAFVFNSDGGRVKELELWSAEDTTPKPFEPKNVLKESLDNAKGFLMQISDGSVTDNTRFSDENIAKTLDGDLVAHNDVYGCLDWTENPPCYVGARYTLKDSVYVSHAMIYSGFDNYKDIYRVYATDTLSDLFSTESIVGNNISCGNEAQRIDINKKVQYIAFVCIGYDGNQRVKEFELWSAEEPEENPGEDPGTDPQPDKTAKVLTIGNSFTENASIFATEIAKSQNCSLTFGYLKYPSSTLDQHYENATNDNAVYKFAYTEYADPSKQNIVNDGDTSKATIKEALQFTDWDIVVIQQGSTASYDYSAYSKAPQLISFIKNELPNAEIMIHETWSWANWAADSNPENNFKNIEDCYHQLSKDNGDLKIIPSGRAFEFARKQGIELNDSDNQHANQYGQFIAGACYVSAIFGLDITDNTFGNGHPYFANVNMDVLRQAVKDAINFEYDPDTNWDWTQPSEKPESNNYISKRLESSAGIIQDVGTGAVSENTRFSAAEADAVNLAIDGDTEEAFEVWGAIDWEYPQNVGVMYALNGVYNLEDAVIYAGTDGEPIKIDIYAAETPDDLYSSKVASNISCSGEKITATINKQAKYIAFIVTDYSAGSSIHISEFDLTGDSEPVKTDDPEPITPEKPTGKNFIAEHLESSAGILQDVGTGAVSENTRFSAADANAVSLSIDGDTSKAFEVWGALDWEFPQNVGVMYALNGVYNLKNAVIYAGSAKEPVTFDIYASETLDDLYYSKVASNIKCSGDKLTQKINKHAKYLAFIVTDYKAGSSFYIAEIDVTGDSKPIKSEEPPTPADEKEDNFIFEHLESSSGILQDVSTGVVAENGRFSAADANAVNLAIDGDTKNTFEVWGALDWEFPQNVGVMYALNGIYNLKNAVIYAGTAREPITIDIYASETLEDLYYSKVASNVQCSGDKLTQKINKKAKYLAFIVTNYKLGSSFYIAEFNITGDSKPIKVAETPSTEENFIAKHLESSAGIVQDVKTGAVSENTRFSAAEANAVNLAIDSNIKDTFEVWGALDWEFPQNVGVMYALNGVYNLKEAVIYAGTTAEPVKVDVYASETFDDLYSSKVASGIECSGKRATAKIGKHAKYIAYIVTDYNIGSSINISEFNVTGDSKPIKTGNTDSKSGDSKASNNFIFRHLDSSTGIIQDVKTGVVSENDRFSAADTDAFKLSIDGDTAKTFEVWGALDWEFPQNVGVMYTLDGVYNLKNAVIYAGTKEQSIKIDVYASDIVGNLYSSKIASDIKCSGKKTAVKINKQVKYLAFIVTYYKADSSINISEFDATGDDTPLKVEKIEWPKAPGTPNILKTAKATKIIAPGGDYLGAKEFDYGFMDADKQDDLSKLVDGVYDKHYDIWNLTSTDKPGVMFELDAYYDVSHLHAFAGVFESELIVNNGFKIYASENLSDLYKTKNLVYSYQNDGDTTNEIGYNTDLSRIKYIAFFLTDSSDGAWRMREFEAYGTKSADQSVAIEPNSIIEGIDAEYYGVATDNLADPIYMGASNFVFALTDGSRDGIEFWGGSDINNSKFVFIYNLYENYDLSGIDIYAAADSIEEDSGIHKGIRSAKVYAARKFEDLFTSKPLVMKEDYEDKNKPDEESYYSAEAKSEWKTVRYIAYVFTIGDSRYGACRLEELKAFGKLSAVQDAEEEELKLPSYIDVKADNGVVARIFALSSTDDLSKLGAKLDVNVDTKAESLKFVNDALSNYDTKSIYRVKVVNSQGNEVDLGGRIVRLSIPVKEKTLQLACVDDYGAEIVSTGLLNDCITVETATLRAYALVNKLESLSAGLFNKNTLIWTAAVITSIASAGFVVSSAFVGLKLLKFKK